MIILTTCGAVFYYNYVYASFQSFFYQKFITTTQFIKNYNIYAMSRFGESQVGTSTHTQYNYNSFAIIIKLNMTTNVGVGNSII